MAELPRRIAIHAARLSRAAVFAGAAACGSTTARTVDPAPPPPPPDPVVVQQFATAPPPAAGKASLRGFVTIDGRPLAGIRVHARGGGTDGHETTTGGKGEYEFVDIEPGAWTVVVDYEMPMYRPQDYVPTPSHSVVLAPGANERSDIALVTPPPPPPDDGPCCKPYGAPPARRRVV